MKKFVFVQTVMCSISYEERLSELEDTSMESTGIPQSTVLHFIALHRYSSFYKLKFCGNLATSKSISIIFPAAFVHILEILTIFLNFSLLYLL